jgi:hypothetical protein
MHYHSSYYRFSCYLPLTGIYIAVDILIGVVQWLRLAFPKGPNRIGVTLLI